MAKKRTRRQHGTGSVYQQKGRANWIVKWHENGQTRLLHGIASEELARDTLTRIQGEIAHGRAGRPPDLKDALSLNAHAAKWLEARKAMRSSYADRNRWANHFEAELGLLKPDQVDVATLKFFIGKKLKEKLSSTTVSLLVRLLSSLYGDLVEDGAARMNPCRLLSKKTRKLLKPAHDPKSTPYLGSLADVMSVHKALEPWPSIATAYAIGALAGLRTGEVRALRWTDVDLTRRDLLVQVQVERRTGKDPETWSKDGTQKTKDDEGRTVPIQPMLVPILAAAKLASGGHRLVCPPLRDRGHLSDRTMSAKLAEVLKALGLAREGLGWYEATRHTFASLFVLGGGTMEDLQRMLGHSTLLVTMRYAHVRPDHFSPAARNQFAARVSKPGRSGSRQVARPISGGTRTAAK